jgi:uncharacterized RDD family membrane protein YckC
MTRIRIGLLALLLAAGSGLPAGVAAQSRSTPTLEESAAARQERLEVEAQIERERWRHPVLRIGQDYTLSTGDAIREAVVIYGTAIIEGRVDRDVVVVFGRAQLASTAVIDGSLIVVGGSAAVMPGAMVQEDLVVVGGAFDAPAGFSPGGHHVVVGTAALGGTLEAIVPWILQGLLWGRLIVPDLPWVWRIVGLFLLVYLVLNLLLHRPVRACAETLTVKPVTAFLVGLLVLLLTGPVCLILAVSVVGIAVVPFVLSAVFVGSIIGKVGVARWIGMSLVPQTSLESRLQALRSFIIGSALIVVAYMVPVLGILTWTMVGVFGLGAATLAFLSAYRRESPPPSPRVASAVAAPPPQYVDERVPRPPVDDAPVAFAPPPPRASPLVMSDLSSFPRAAFRDRFSAFVLDVILVIITVQLLDMTRREESAVFLLLLVYHIGFWTWKGTTVGGIICQLRVVRVDGAPLRLADAVVRGLSSIFSLAVLGLGCLWILKDPEQQAWHDKIAGTYVVRVPRNFPI